MRGPFLAPGLLGHHDRDELGVEHGLVHGGPALDHEEGLGDRDTAATASRCLPEALRLVEHVDRHDEHSSGRHSHRLQRSRHDLRDIYNCS
jgi:hypothetical protein